MKIAVIFIDGTPSVVNAKDLEYLIRKRQILSFRRSGAWVRVGYDPLRGSGEPKKYSGRDRRCNQG